MKNLEQIIEELLLQLVSSQKLQAAGIKDIAYALKVLAQIKRDVAIMDRGFDAPKNWLEKMISEADALKDMDMAG